MANGTQWLQRVKHEVNNEQKTKQKKDQKIEQSQNNFALKDLNISQNQNSKLSTLSLYGKKERKKQITITYYIGCKGK